VTLAASGIVTSCCCYCKVKVALPAGIPVTESCVVNSCYSLLLLVQVPPVVGDRIVVKPTHIARAAGSAVTQR